MKEVINEDLTMVKYMIVYPLAAMFALMLVIASCSQVNDYFKLPDDNFVEEGVEAIIYRETGLRIDLTPRSQEQKEYMEFMEKNGLNKKVRNETSSINFYPLESI